METVGKQVQVVSGLGGPVGPVGPVGGDLHHHHHPHPHAHPPHPHPHPHGHPHGSHGHSLVGATSNPGRGQAQPPVSHNQHLPARSTPVQLHRPTQSYVNIKSSSPVSPRTVGTGATYVQGGAAASSATAAAAAAAATAGGPAVVAGVSTATSSNSGVVGVSNVLSVAAGGNSVSNNNASNGSAGNNTGGNSGSNGSSGGGGVAGSGSSNNGSGGGGGGTASGTPYVTVPSMLRYIHSYPPTSVSAPAVAAVVTTAPSPAAPVPIPAPAPAPPPSQPTVIASQTPPPPLTGTAYTARDAYRASTTNVNERIAISVSNSPLSQVGVGVVAEYSGMGTGGRGDRPRISLLPPTGSSVTPIPSPTAVAASEYQQHAAAARNPPRVGLMPVQPDQYCTRTAIDMASLQQDTPPFKKIRLGQPHQQVQQLQSQSQSRCQSLSPADPCGGKQEQQQQQHVVQLQQPLRIDTREQPAVGAYTPQTEAISPTLPEPNTQEDALRSTKDELLQQIGKVDREIAKRENQLNMLRKRIKELEEAANKPLEAGGLKRNIEEQSQQPKHQSLAQKIYAENRRKAEEAHRLMEKLGPKIELPLYNQPSDTSVYQENRTRHQTCMRTRLIARLRRDHTERASLHQQQTQTYTILVQEWHRKVERLEATQKRKSKETKNREFFEKVFPELRKQREDKERFNRVGARIKSEADLEEIMDGLQEQEEETLQDLKNFIKAYQLEDKKMRSYAVIPPLLLDAKQRRIAFQNRNGLLQPEELEALHSERKLINVWSSVEHESFKEKYLQHPKNYGVIAQSLEHKGVQDCVHHYYLTKKTENYKQLLRKSRQRTRSSRNNPNNKVNNTNSTIGSIDILTTGVTTRLQREQQKTQENPIDILTAGITTRLQREQQQKTQENPQNSSVTATTTSTTSTTVTSSVSSTTVTTTTVTTTTTPLSSTASGVNVTADSVTASTTTTTTSVLNTTASSVSATSTTSSTKDSRETSKENKENKTDSKESHLVKMDSKDEAQLEMGKDIKVIMEGKGALSSSASSLNINATNVSTIQSDFKESSKKKPGCRDTSGSGANVATSSRIKDKKKENHTPMETSDEEAPSIDIIESGRQIGPHACTVCQSVVEGSAHSRALPRSQASQYGLREDQVPVGARVCNTCRCKAVRGRYTTCPLPGCPNLNSSKSRIKRLRALPSKWLDLPLEIREPIAQEFQIPNNATKCCSACFSRISRRLAPHLTGGTEASEDGADAMLRQWTDEELEQLRKALREYGTNWPKIAEQIPGKTSQQCKNYYFAYRKKLTLDQVVSEYYTLLGEERRPPYVTDEEESGSSTSSCDELAVHDSSDTASAGSPATTMTGSNAAVIPSGGPTATSSSLSFQRPSELGSLEKLGEKISDITVVSLVPPAGSSHQSSSGGAAVTSGGAREDYDSSATETADEGQGGADLDNGSVVVTMTASGNATSLQQQSQHQQPPPATAHSPPSTTSNSNPLTVKDLMLGVIEMQLKRTPNSPADNGGSSAPNSSGTPTISSILKTDHRNDITYVRGYKPSSSMTNTALPNRDTNLATLSVVSGPHHGHRSAPSPQQIGQMQATITPCPPAAPNSQASSSDLLPKEGLVVMQVQQALRETEGTLDLSIKKPRLQQDYNHSIQIHKPPTVTLYRPEPPPGAYYHPHTTPHPEQGRNAKSPLVYASTPRPQASITPKMNKVTVPQTHPKLSPKLSSMSTPGHKGGSITHGTPVSTARYEGLLRQMTPPGNPPVSGASANVSERGGGVVNASSAGPGAPKETGGGSITQGTPVLPFAVDKRGAPIYDYHRTIRHSPVTGSGNVPPPPPGQGPASQSASPAVVVSHGGSQYNSYSAAGRPPPSYTMEQQLSSRQIIMNDYITSQQMHARARGSGSAGASVTGEMAGKSEPPPPPSSTLYYASTPPPPPPQTHTQPRQGVIQRHNTQKQMHYPPQPPIMDAFSNLVEVAIKQPTLPVPHPHGHPTASGSGGHEGLGKTMADRLLADRYDNNRAFREQEIRMQEHRMAEHRLAQQHQRERERERDIVHLREKEEHRLHREKELQQLEHRLAVQQHHQHREKDFQQQEHRLASQREKDMHVEHTRLQIREKDISHEHRLIHQQREKEIHQQMAAAAQREKEHEHRLAVQQREKEIQHQEQRLAIQQQRENPHVVGSPIQQHAEHRLAVQQAHRERDLVHLHQQQQQQQIQQHIQQQRIEIERRHMAQLFRDQQQQQQQLDRDSSRLLSSGFSQSSRLQQSQQSQQQQQQQQSSSRQNQSSNQQQNDSSSTLTAASLIDAIITHQINQGVDNASASGSSTNQPTRAGDRLFQGFHRETPQEPNGIAHSPAGEGSGGGASGNGSGCSKAMTLGEHVEHIISKDYGPPHSSYRPYGYPISEDQWKRRKHNEPDSVKTGDERQIIRVAQQQQQQQQTQQQQQQTQQHQSSGKQQYHSVEPLSPPETTANHYGRRFYEPSTATSTSGTPSNKPHQISPFDYVKNKIVEVMRTEDDKAGGCGGSSGGDNGAGSDRNGGGNTVVTTEKDEKGAGSVDRSPSGNGGSGSGGGEMVIDDTGGSTREQPPPPPPAPAATTTFYPFSALGVHTGPPPAPPPASATSASVTKSEQMQAEPAPLLSAQYEPLSDED